MSLLAFKYTLYINYFFHLQAKIKYPPDGMRS